MPAPPRKLIWLVAEASGVPGSGETAIGFALATAASCSTGGISAEELLPQAISAAAQPVAASSVRPARRSPVAGATRCGTSVVEDLSGI